MEEIGECCLDGVRPVALIHVPESLVVRVTQQAGGGQAVRVQVSDAAFISQVAALETRVMKEWFDVDKSVSDVGMMEMSLRVAQGTRLYDKSNGSWVRLPEAGLRVGDKVGFNVLLRKRGEHTIMEDHQVLAYDCYSMVGCLTLLVT